MLATPIPPSYAILSHTWGDEEVSFQDLQELRRDGGESPTARHVVSQMGYRKIERCCQQALREGYDWVWIDTCCIDKTSSSELSEAINSMFRWYKNSAKCYAYLEDVSAADGPVDAPESSFRQSRWFTRGWTLQELLAPRSLEFLDASWMSLGKLTASSSLARAISAVTTIPEEYFFGTDLGVTSIAQRMSWASHRTTTRTEDLAYCLLGIFDVNMPLLYGEGRKAFLRLQEEIIKNSNDQTLLAWGFGIPPDSALLSHSSGCFADSPKVFTGCSNVVPFESSLDESEMTYQLQVMTNQGLRLRLSFASSEFRMVYGLLNCCDLSDPSSRIGIPLQAFQSPGSISYALGQIDDDTILMRRNHPPQLHYDFLRADANFRTVYIMKGNHPRMDPRQISHRPSIISIFPPPGFTHQILYMDPCFQPRVTGTGRSNLLVDIVTATAWPEDRKPKRICLRLSPDTLKEQQEDFIALLKWTPSVLFPDIECSIGKIPPDFTPPSNDLEFDFIPGYFPQSKLRLDNTLITVRNRKSGSDLIRYVWTVKMDSSRWDQRLNPLNTFLYDLLPWPRYLFNLAATITIASTLRIAGIFFIHLSLAQEVHSVRRTLYLAMGIFMSCKPRQPVFGPRLMVADEMIFIVALGYASIML